MTAPMNTVEEYLATLPEPARGWVSEFIDDTAAHYPSVPLVMFRQRPMFKFGASYQQGYVMFTAAKHHFAAHAIDFDLVEQTRAAIPGARGGKGSVAVKYTNEGAKPELRRFVDAVMARHGVSPA